MQKKPLREHGEHCAAKPYTILTQLAKENVSIGKREMLAVTILVCRYAGPTSASMAALVSAVEGAAETQRSNIRGEKIL